MAAKKTPAVKQLAVEGEMTIFNASAIREQLLQGLQANKTLHVDLSAVTEFDTAGLQLMLASKTLADKQQITLRFTQPAEAVTELLELSGMQALLA